MIGILISSFYMEAQDDKKLLETKQDSVYCLVMKDGLAVLTSSSGRVITNEVSLPNGARLSTKGIITRKNGTQIIMKDGDCTNTLGEPMNGSSQSSGRGKRN